MTFITWGPLAYSYRSSLTFWRMWFLPRDSMRKHGLCCRRVSVRLSVTSQTSVSRRLKIPSNFFLGPIAHHSSFLTPNAGIPNSRGTPSAWALNTRGWENLRFSTEIAGRRLLFHCCYGTLIGSHRWGIDPCRFRWPWKVGCDGSFFRRISNARIVWPRTTKFGRIVHVGMGVFLGVNYARPLRKERGPSASQFWGFTSMYAYTLLTQNYQIWRDNTYGEGLVFRWPATPPH